MAKTIITKQHAEAIATKLGADIRAKKGRAHDLAVVYHDEVRIATFGIRRGSKKDLGHDHIPGALHLSPHDCRLLAECEITLDEWIERLRRLGLVE